MTDDVETLRAALAFAAEVIGTTPENLVEASAGGELVAPTKEEALSAVIGGISSSLVRNAAALRAPPRDGDIEGFGAQGIYYSTDYLTYRRRLTRQARAEVRLMATAAASMGDKDAQAALFATQVKALKVSMNQIQIIANGGDVPVREILGGSAAPNVREVSAPAPPLPPLGEPPLR